MTNTFSEEQIQEILAQLHEYERIVLPLLQKSSSHQELLESTKLEEIQLSRAYQWLENKKLIELTYEKEQFVVLGKNGKEYAESKLPELRLLTQISDGKSYNAESITTVTHQERGAVIGLLKQHNLATVEKTDDGLMFQITTEGKEFLEKNYDEQLFLEELFPLSVDSLSKNQQDTLFRLQKRKDMVQLEVKQTPIVKLTELGEHIAKQDLSQSLAHSALTSELLKSGEWNDKPFRPFDATTKVPTIYGGRVHPMTAVIRLVRDIFVEMGFSEMQGPWVETAFWCMDSMWIPQDHPARDEQDTFYLHEEGDLPEDEIVRRVKEEHEEGKLSGSKGYKYQWDPKRAAQLLLRTHTTSTSFRLLSKSKNEPMLKKFYVGKVFRNEAIDATHLPEFYQVEGFVMGEGLTIQDLIGVIKTFYAKLGFTKIKFKPTYNPYTESSLEAFYYDDKRKKWMELINSGMFRPESLAPYGIEKPVIAWGLGLERLAMLMLEQGKLKDIIGPQNDLRWLRSYKAPRRAL